MGISQNKLNRWSWNCLRCERVCLCWRGHTHLSVNQSQLQINIAFLEGGDDDWQAEDNVSHPALSPSDDVIVPPGIWLMWQIEREIKEKKRARKWKEALLLRERAGDRGMAHHSHVSVAEKWPKNKLHGRLNCGRPEYRCWNCVPVPLSVLVLCVFPSIILCVHKCKHEGVWDQPKWEFSASICGHKRTCTCTSYLIKEE